LLHRPVINAFEIAADGLTKVLAEDADHGPREEQDDATLVEELEEPVVDARLIKLKVLGDVVQKMHHFQLFFANYYFTKTQKLHIQTNNI
jgi:hypothetical protein